MKQLNDIRIEWITVSHHLKRINRNSISIRFDAMSRGVFDCQPDAARSAHAHRSRRSRRCRSQNGSLAVCAFFRRFVWLIAAIASLADSNTFGRLHAQLLIDRFRIYWYNFACTRARSRQSSTEYSRIEWMDAYLICREIFYFIDSERMSP